MLFYLRGIIPARAGFTVLNSNFLSAVWDHPRSRGVYDYCVYCGHVVGGSSPLARGLLSNHRITFRQLRIIPARAGFTLWTAATRCVMKDHPRSRGVYSSISTWCLSRTGSSPLARGLRIGLTTLLRLFRIIPARAGFTNKMSDFAGGFEDHPRSRGVYALVSGITLTFGGSSPLARGLPGNS